MHCNMFTGLEKVDIFAHPEFQEIETQNPKIENGGKWQPNGCEAWQKVGEFWQLSFYYVEAWFLLEIVVE